jgi:hypothetical protein
MKTIRLASVLLLAFVVGTNVVPQATALPTPATQSVLSCPACNTRADCEACGCFKCSPAHRCICPV